VGNAIAATTAGNAAAGVIAEGSGNQGYGVYAASFGPGGIALQGYNTASTGNAGNFYMDNPNIPNSGGDADAVVYAANAGGSGSTLGYYGHAGAFFENNASNQSATLYAQGSGTNAAVMGYTRPEARTGVKGEAYSGVGVWGQSDGQGFVAYFNSTVTGGSCVYVGGTGWDCSAGADVARSPEAFRVINGRREGERGELADTWDRHQPAARIGCPDHPPDIRIDRRNGGEHSRTRRDQSAHGSGMPSLAPSACLTKAAVNARGSRTPNTTARPRIWFSSVTRWPTSFLRAMISDRKACAARDFT
jgi:hypothetical protein